MFCRGDLDCEEGLSGVSGYFVDCARVNTATFLIS